MTTSLLDQLIAELARTGMVLGALPPSLANDEDMSVWIIARRLTARIERDGSMRMTAPIMLTATSAEQMIRQLETLPADPTFALEID